ncbi:hypothetical protein DFH06DRAFT_1321616 [Mycena polygramma]|nr:hypothetical protein DFH06DRAFT_1321616 [Mycena polygramma]
MKRRRDGREVYKNTKRDEQSITTRGNNWRVVEEFRPAAPRSPTKAGHTDIFDELMGFDEDSPLEPNPPIIAEGPAALKIKSKKKAKRYENSDYPVKSWIPFRDDYLDGLLTLKGRGPWWSAGCTVCEQPNASWRCEDCFGNRLFCEACVIEKHRDEPLHLLEEWDNGYFQRRTLGELGQTFPIGHRAGMDCPRSYLGAPRPMVILHNNAIHTIKVEFCYCDDAPSDVAQLLNVGWFPATHKDPSTAATLSLLDRFHKLNLQARLPAYDFYNTLVLITDGAGLKKPPNRLPQFMNMIREFRHLEMCKRCGRGHHPEGIATTQPGELCVECRACPIPGVNLPDDWRDAPPEIAWIYRLILSEDANFKMKGRDRSSREKDPTLGPGWAYMVASDLYLSYLVKHINEDEISHCVAFAALWSANNKCAKGLRASGVGSVSCSRHEIFRPQGTGDLQKGERYSNMDYLFFSSIVGITLLTVIASYDIACQWGRTFWTRASKMPDRLKLPDWLEIIFKVPKFHLPPHVKKCHSPFSFNYTRGVGRTDGEGVERNWSWLNWAARSVSVMGPGSREDTIDDLCGFSNWKKTVDLGNSLLRKMVLAIPQAMIHSRAFHSFTTGLQDGHEEDLQKWEQMVRDWEADSDDCEDPYDYAEVEANTMADVLRRLAEEEHARVSREGVPVMLIKPGPFLIAGLEIQETQAALLLEAKRVNRTTIQATTLQRSRTVLLGKIKALHDIQDTYMPGLSTWLAQQKPALPTGSNAKPETIPIYLPSSLPAAAREAVCSAALVQQEEELRQAQAGESLRDLRAGLRTRTFAHQFRRKHMSGQGMYSRSRELLDGIEDRIRTAATRYRAAREALLALRGPGTWESELQELKQTDVRGMNERGLNDEEKEENRKARALAGLSAEADGGDIDEYGEAVELTVLFSLEPGEGRRNLSWIWYTASNGDLDVGADGALHEDIRVEWAKARARAGRWREELILVDEEMRRVLEFCAYKARWWEARLEPQRDPDRGEISPELAEGQRAYALAQIAREREWQATWEKKWAAVRERAKLVMRDHIVDASLLVPLEVELDDVLEEEDGYDDFGEEDDLL